MEDQEKEDEAKKVKEDDVMTWTGRRLGEYDKVGQHAAATKRTANEDALIVDTITEQEPAKKKLKASGFGNFAGW